MKGVLLLCVHPQKQISKVLSRLWLQCLNWAKYVVKTTTKSAAMPPIKYYFGLALNFSEIEAFTRHTCSTLDFQFNTLVGIALFWGEGNLCRMRLCDSRQANVGCMRTQTGNCTKMSVREVRIPWISFRLNCGKRGDGSLVARYQSSFLASQLSMKLRWQNVRITWNIPDLPLLVVSAKATHQIILQPKDTV